MARALVLTAITGTQLGKAYTIEGRSATVGSNPHNDVVLSDRAVEPRHAELRQVLDRWFIVPASSTAQRISVNGLPIQGQSRVNAGDTVTIGSITYRVSLIELQEKESGGPVGATSSVPRIGEYLLRRGAISNEQLERVLQRQSDLKRSGSQITLGQVAFEMGYINRYQLEAALADQRSDFYERLSD